MPGDDTSGAEKNNSISNLAAGDAQSRQRKQSNVDKTSREGGSRKQSNVSSGAADRKFSAFFKEGGNDAINELLEAEDACTPSTRQPDARKKYSKDSLLQQFK